MHSIGVENQSTMLIQLSIKYFREFIPYFELKSLIKYFCFDTESILIKYTEMSTLSSSETHISITPLHTSFYYSTRGYYILGEQYAIVNETTSEWMQIFTPHNNQTECYAQTTTLDICIIRVTNRNWKFHPNI